MIFKNKIRIEWDISPGHKQVADVMRFEFFRQLSIYRVNILLD